MANIIIKSDERRGRVAYVLREYGGMASAERREAAECIAAKVTEAYRELGKMDDKNREGKKL